MINLGFQHTMQLLAKTGEASILFFQWIRALIDRVNFISPKVGDFRSSTNPDPRVGELLADGSDVSRADYAQLFDAIGTTFGAGDGTTTFTLPDLSAIAADVYYFVRVD